MPENEVVIAGAGIIGLSLALEMHIRGWAVTVFESGRAMAQASTAAAGMLAVEDPHNPSALLPLSRHSAALYPTFLQRLQDVGGCIVPFQTNLTVQHLGDNGEQHLQEHSLDPRQLAEALLAAVKATSIQLQENHALTPEKTPISAKVLVHATGAWFRNTRGSVFPRKGQMLRVRLPKPLVEVHRSHEFYIVPRTSGPQAGTALIGATIEDAGFDLTTHPADLARLRQRAAQWIPEIASETEAPTVEAWAGLRPATQDGLPLLGEIVPGGILLGELSPPLPDRPREFVTTGHFRNGILLAPATADVMADLIEGKQPAIDLAAFSPAR